MKADPVTFRPKDDPNTAVTTLTTALEQTESALAAALKRIEQYNNTIRAERQDIAVYRREILRLKVAINVLES